MARGAQNVEDLVQDFLDSVWVFLGVGLVVMVGVWLVTRLRSRLRDDEGSATGHHRMLSQLRDLHREGEISDEEYRSIKGRLVEKLDGTRPVVTQTTDSGPDRAEEDAPTGESAEDGKTDPNSGSDIPV